MKMDKEQARLNNAIKAWNESRLDLFGISQPNKEFEFHGVIRFYHQDSSNNAKYATKCVRVSSTAFTYDVIETLAEKFRSDMRMLTKPNYGLYEVHVDGESRKLKDEERPLLVQLNWIKDDREGRFLLRNEDDKRPLQVGNGMYEESEDTIKGFKLTRNLTKKEKKQKKKKEKEKIIKNEKEGLQKPAEVSAAKQLYNQVPESTFTRTVSNPEAVMKKRREQKLQKRGAETLKIYGDSINHEIPYKTLLLLPTDKTDTVIRDTLDKYSLGRDKTSDYDIVQVVLPPGSKPEECLEGGWGKETILGPNECPLDIEQKWQPHQGTLVFQLRKNIKRSSTNNNNSRNKTSPKTSTTSINSNEKQPEETKKSSLKQKEPQRKDQRKRTTSETEKQDSRKNVIPKSVVPKFVEFSTTSDKFHIHDIAPNVTEIGSNRKSANYGPFIELRAVPGLLSAHCVVTNMDSVVTVTPHEGGGEVFVDNRVIEETTMLSHADIVWLGRNKELVFCEPNRDLLIPEIRKKIKFMFPQIKHMKNKAHGNTGKIEKVDNYPQSPINKFEQRGSGKRQQEMKRQYSSQQQRPHSTSSGTQSDLSPYHHEGKYPEGKYPNATLPAYLKINPEAEETFLSEILSVNGHSLHFKLSPAYSIYLALRDLLSENKTSFINEFLITVTDLLEQTIQIHRTSVSELSFWMANTSELLNFVRQDQQLCLITGEAQDTFAKTVQLAFRHLVQCMQRTLFALMPAFLSESDEDLPGEGAVDLKKQKQGSEDPTMYDILHMLTSAMSLLRRCRVNAALTIQLFSQLFHSINMWLFNKLVTTQSARVLCCRQWGIRIRARLALVETWAEKQGLELAADCHLARITQATHLLQAPKQSAEDIAAISGTCFKLNSLQLRALLSNYQPHTELGERLISMELIDKVVTVAEGSADELTRSDGRDVRLKEDPDLQLPFLLPEDGYSCDVVRGIPSGLTEFIHAYQQDDLCSFEPEPESNGSWTVYFNNMAPNIVAQISTTPREVPSPQLPPTPEVISITFNKKGGGMGLSIVAARGSGQSKLGIYVRSVVPGGAAYADGRLLAGDQLLSVDGNSLVGLDQEKAATLMTKTGQTVTLEVAKQGAVYHGLATLLSQPSPKLQRPPQQQQQQQQQQRPFNPRPKSEGFALTNNKAARGSGHNSAYSSLFDNEGRPFKPQAKQNPNLNKSTPHLNEKYEPTNQRLPSNNNPPRSAMSMQNLQQPNVDPEHRNSRNWRQDSHVMASQLKPSKEASYQNQRQKATSSTAISKIPNQHEPARIEKPRFESQDRFKPHKSYSHDNLPSPPSLTNEITRNSPHSSLDNPNYDHFPLPPPDLTENAPSDKLSTPRFKEPSPMPDGKSPRQTQGSKTLGRMTTGKAPEVARVTPTQKKAPTPNKESSSKPTSKRDPKSSTLPRHFKSTSVWERDEREKQEQAIQEQLNALRDEEIEELEAKDKEELNSHEKDRLKNLLQERDFQNRVQEEKMRIFSDEDNSEEDFSVPDRPDRDRLIRIQDAQGQRSVKEEREAEKKKEMKEREAEKLRWEEEQKRKKEEAERRAEEEKERRERRARERERKRIEAEALEEKRKAERRREEQRRFEEERREEEQRREDQRREEEQRREDQRREDEQRREYERREEERKRQEERRRVMSPRSYNNENVPRNYNDQMSPRNYNNENKWSDKQSNIRKIRDEEEEQRKRLEELRRMREEEEEHLRELKAKREAEERNYRFENENRRRQDKLLKQKEAEEREEAEREFLEEKLSQGKRPSFYKKSPYQGGTSPQPFHPRSTSTSNYNRFSPDSNLSKPVLRENSGRSAMRPVSDGYMLGRQWEDEETSPVPAVTPPPSRRPISYVATSRTPGVIGSQEVYNDPRNKREATLKKEQSFKRRAADPSKLTFKDRQRLFQADRGSPINKPKTSRKLLELEQSLKGHM